MRTKATRVLLWSALIAAAVLLVGALGGWWLLGSAGGRDLALQRVIAALPEGALRIGERQGSVAGGLVLRDVVYENESVRVAIDELVATPRFPGLRTRTVNLSELRVRGIDVQPKPGDEPPTPWPRMLPALDLPLALTIDAFEITGLVVHAAPEAGAAPPPTRVDRITGTAALVPGRVDLGELAVDAPQGRASGALSYRPRDDFATTLGLDVVLAAGARLALRLDGTLSQGRASIEGEAGGPLDVAFEWEDAASPDTLGWTLDADGDRLDLSTLIAPAAAGDSTDPAGSTSASAERAERAERTERAERLDLALRARGGTRLAESADGDAAGTDDAVGATASPGLRVALEGRVAQGDLDVQLRDSRLRFHDGVLYAEPLALSLLDGDVELRGRYGLDDGAMDLVASLRGLAWGEGDARVRADGAATLRGVVEEWRAGLDLDLARGAQRAQLDGEARGTREAITLAPLTLTTPGGAFEGEARYALGASGAFALRGRMRNLDPAWLAPGWPGRIDGALRVEGAAPEGAPLGYVAVVEGLQGVLRGQRVAGSARLEASGETMRIETDLALGDGRVEARGALAPTLDLDVRIRALDVGPWIDGARGAVDGTLRLRGSAERPALDADLAVLDGGFGDLAVQRITARGALPERGDGRFVIRIEELADGASRVESIDLALDGALREGRFTVAARGIDAPNLPAPEAERFGTLDASGRWRAEPGFERGRLDLESLAARLPRLPEVALAAPATLEWRGDAWTLPQRACLGIGRGGTLCARGDSRDVRIDGRALDLAWLAPFLPDDADTPLAPAGLVALQASRRSTPQGSISTLRVEAPRGELRVGGAAPDVLFGWRDLVFEAERSRGWNATLRAALGRDGRVDARVAADAAGALDGEIALRMTDLTVLEILSTDLIAPRGVVDGTLRLSGTTDAPRWQGAVAAAPFAVDLPALGIAVVDGELRLEGDADGQLRVRGRLPTGDGALELAGQWSPDERPNTLAIRGENVRVLDTPDGRAWISPALDVEVRDGVAKVRGRVDVPRAALDLERFEQSVDVSDDVVVVDDPDAGEEAAGLTLDADFILALGDDIDLRGFGFDGSLAGELRVRDRVDREPRATGTLELDGEVRAYGQQLDLERGRLRWRNSPIDEPRLDIRAARPDSDPEVGIAVTGTASAPSIEVWSRPPLPQSEALSWLMFGHPLAAADGEDAARLQQAAASLGGSAVAQAVASRVGLDSASVGQSRALGGTALTLGNRITPKLYVSYGMALSGTGQVVTVTYALRRWLSAQFESGIEQRLELEAAFDRD